jgi:hypothetical protein
MLSKFSQQHRNYLRRRPDSANTIGISMCTDPVKATAELFKMACPFHNADLSYDK